MRVEARFRATKRKRGTLGSKYFRAWKAMFSQHQITLARFVRESEDLYASV